MASKAAKTGAAGGAVAVLVAAAVLVSKWEGVRYQAYADPATHGAPYTACYGHTGPEVVRGSSFTKAQCDAFLQADLLAANRALHRCIPGVIPTSVAVAYTSAIFNLGPGLVCTNGKAPSAALLSRNWRQACAVLDRYKYAAGRVMRGLVLRRADERKVCEAGL